MVIIRVGLANRAETNVQSTPADMGRDRRLRMQVHITTFTESKTDIGRISLMTPIDSNNYEDEGKHYGV